MTNPDTTLRARARRSWQHVDTRVRELLVWNNLYRATSYLKSALWIVPVLSILFVPAGVGVMAQMHRISQEWLPIVAAVAISTWLAIGAGALVTRALMRRMGDRGEAHEEVAP